jgi:hypothetical protein
MRLVSLAISLLLVALEQLHETRQIFIALWRFWKRIPRFENSSFLFPCSHQVRRQSSQTCAIALCEYCEMHPLSIPNCVNLWSLQWRQRMSLRCDYSSAAAAAAVVQRVLCVSKMINATLQADLRAQ